MEWKNTLPHLFCRAGVANVCCRKIAILFVFVFLGTVFAHAGRVRDLPSSANGTGACSNNNPACLCSNFDETPFLARLDGTQSPPSGCSWTTPYPNRVVTLSHTNPNFTVTLTPVIWDNSEFNKKTIFQVQFSGDAGLQLHYVAIGNVLSNPTYVVCDPNNPNDGAYPFCVTVNSQQLEALEPTAVTGADNTMTRWDFHQFTSGNANLDIVVDGFPSEFQNIDGQPDSNGLTPQFFTPANFLAEVEDSTGRIVTAGGLTVHAAFASTNDTTGTAIAVALPYHGMANTSGTHPQEDPVTGAEVDSQNDPPPPSNCSPYPSRVFRSVWYTFTGTGGQVTVSTRGSRYDTLIYIFTGSPTNPTTVACNDDGSEHDIGGVESDATFPTTASTTYYLMVSETPPDVLDITGGGTEAVPLANDATLNLSIVAGTYAGGYQFVSTGPCRLVDTRQNQDPIEGGTSRSFAIPQLGNCNIPSSAAAYSLNVTVAPHGPLGYLTIWPTGQTQPVVSTMNSPDGRTKANAAIVPAGTQGAVSVYVSNTTDVILDIAGYFLQPAQNTYEFYPLTPCRVIDTRGMNGELGGPFLVGQQERDFLVLESSCVPSGVSIAAYSMNFTVAPHTTGQPLGYLTVWPAGQPQPTVSVLNNPTATVVANAAIVPAGSNGAIATFPSDDTELIVDINGYFAAPAQNGASLYTVVPCRSYDSRANNGNPFQGERTVNVVASPCAPPADAQAFVLNATVVPAGSLGYLTLWPDGQPQPQVSTLNAYDGFVTSNMAIVPNLDGLTDAFAAGYTQLILDISSYFAP
jgi:hypothetical protein